MDLPQMKAEYVHLRDQWASLRRCLSMEYPHMTPAEFNTYLETLVSISVDLGRLTLEIREEEQNLFERNKK